MVSHWFVVMGTVLLSTACIQPEARSEDDSNSSGAYYQATVHEETDGQAVLQQVPEAELELRLDLPDMIEVVMPSVVGIATERTVRQQTRGSAPGGQHPFFRDFDSFFGPPPQQRAPRQPETRDRVQEGIGSGVIVDSSGVVVTNNHVIAQADIIRINLSDGRELSAEVVGADPASDLAVLRIIDAPDDLKAIEFGDSEALRLGESVIAIGNPFGLSSTVTRGIISAKGRANVGIVDYENFLQTDAAINPGNSGGALINADGELVGINTAIMTRSGGYQGVGFAIPSNMAKSVMTGLVEDGHVDRGWLGVAIQQLTPELAAALELGDGIEGVLVSDVQPGSPAEQFGLLRGDLITRVQGRQMRSPQELRNTIGLRSSGHEVDVEYVRNGATETVSVVLGSLSDAQAIARGRNVPEVEVETGVEGLTLQSLNKELRSEFNVPDMIRDGVVVASVRPNSEAAHLDLRKGDVILEVNRRPVTSLDEFNAAYESDRARNLFLLYRDGATIFMTR